MAKPRVFVSSTYYDLKHARAALKEFVKDIGFEPVLSERGKVAFIPGQQPDESCYGEVLNADIFVIVIGSRYGSPASTQTQPSQEELTEELDFYESVTSKELETAVKRGIPVFVLVDSAVDHEYGTYKKNKPNMIALEYCESVNVPRLLEYIDGLPVRPAKQQFTDVSEIIDWLKEQWAGWFRELMHRESSLRQLSDLSGQVTSLSEQVAVLREVGTSLQKYLEVLLDDAVPDRSAEVIRDENTRLLNSALERNAFVMMTRAMFGVGLSVVREIVTEATSVEDTLDRVAKLSAEDENVEKLRDLLTGGGVILDGLNNARELLGKPKFELEAPVRPFYASSGSIPVYSSKVYLRPEDYSSMGGKYVWKGSATGPAANVTPPSAELPEDPEE